MKAGITQILATFFILLFSWSTLVAQRDGIDKLVDEYRKSFNNPEALELSRKFIQLDSTYYMGYYFEGAYRFNRAADKRGYRGAIKPLKKALELIEKDYGWQIVRYTSFQNYYAAFKRQRDYCNIVDFLQTSYQNIEMPKEAVEMLHQLNKKLLILEFRGSPYSTLAWIYHRNRMHYEKHHFLKPSIQENVDQALLFLDSIQRVNNRNFPHIRNWFPGHAEIFKSFQNEIYHYRQMMHSYLINIDSAEYYSKKMKDIGRLSYNNYGNLQFVKGDFDKAIFNYEYRQNQGDFGDKRFREYDYMLASIYNFRGEPKKGIDLIKRTIAEVGPTPGYGWYNFSLARSYYYSGQVEKSMKHQERAGKFEDLHIGTTHGEVMYSRTNLVLKYLNLSQQIKQIIFEDSFFWLSLKKVFKLVNLYLERKSTHLLITSQLAADPERDMVTYNIFASENLIFYDELWPMIKDFNAQFFIEKFKNKIEEDQRPKVKKYFNYYIGKFHLEEGETAEAKRYFEKVLADTSLDAVNEKLLLARTHEALAELYDEEDNENKRDEEMIEFMKIYPQLVPFSEQKMKFHLKVERAELDTLASIEKALTNLSLDWQETEDDKHYPTLTVTLEDADDNVKVNIKMKRQGNVTMNKDIVLRKRDGDLHKAIIYTVFEIRDEEKPKEEDNPSEQLKNVEA
ncbi:MAG: hypothetical protein ACPGJS_20480 [Flammeovirgaceae bacterium]